MNAPPRFASGFVTIVGRPNVGKSTLTNLLVGQKVSIVSDVPQTTRRRIHGIVHHPRGQIVLVDTPGIHRPQHAMNRWMVAEATGSMQEVDLILFMVEAAPGRRPGADPGIGPGDRFILSQLPRQGPPVVLAINKIDLVRKEQLLPLIDRVKNLFPFREILLMSALTGENAGDLAERLLAHLPEGPALYPQDQPTDQHERRMAAELVREKILHHTRQEIPHETAVLIDRFERADSGLITIEASILVEKESQKKIVIGHEGQMLKVVGSEARAELEDLLDGRIFLKLWVKVRQGWRDDERTLRELGIGPAGSG
ncbi:MAG TPA: GTPase Era [Candidatus Polarisedimenticolia bacterium]|nr:GTPase Era [Candidatus Polarisedimenticolia bacterium]